MKALTLPTALALALALAAASGPTQAKDCPKISAMGGIYGHNAHRGIPAGPDSCAVGRHTPKQKRKPVDQDELDEEEQIKPERNR
jgi:hypothetical protein